MRQGGVMTGFYGGKCVCHVISRVGFQNIMLDGVAHDGSDTLAQPLCDIVLALLINGFNRC